MPLLGDPRLHSRRTLALLLLWSAAAPASAAVTRVEVRDAGAYERGVSFGAVGPYRRLAGRVEFAVDPRLPANRAVVDLDLAPRNAAGRVEFAADFELLAPADLTRANGTLLYDVNNRGNRTALGMFNGGGADGFLMRQGYLVLSSGWIAELLPGDGRLRLEAPIARVGGRPLVGRVRAEMAPDADARRLSLAQWANHGSFPPTARGLREATLTMRLREQDPRRAVPRSQWRLEVTPVPGSALPRVEVELDGEGFRAGRLYEVIYEAEGPPVQGLGLAGIRDLVSFLKHDAGSGNPLRLPDGTPAARRAIGFGVSQSGRCLRQLVYDGFNADESGRRVFDGLFPHVAGAGLGFFNHRFASPTRHNAQHDNHLYPADAFPFGYQDERDPFTGRTDGLLRRARAAGVTPRVVHTQTSAEYWSRSGSLVHTTPDGRRDAVLPPEVRVYAIGGAQHGAGNGLPAPPGNGQLPANPTDYRPLLRGLLTALDAWIRAGTEPPPSVYPRLADGTLAPWEERESGWRPLPGVRYPQVIQQPEWLDHGPDYPRKRRLTVLPPRSRGRYPVLAPRVGWDNNERGMLLLPTVAVPRGTFTGWNLRAPRIGAETELLSLAGGFIPFAADAAARKAAGDPRPSLQERYPSPAAYLDPLTRHLDTLIGARYLLPEDRERILSLARRLALD
jgi:hypothetical protein